MYINQVVYQVCIVMFINIYLRISLIDWLIYLMFHYVRVFIHQNGH